MSTDEQAGGGGRVAFVSSYTHSLDPKKRLTIPSEWREKVLPDKSLYVLPDVHKPCLCVFPGAEMAHKLQKVRNRAFSDQQARKFARVLASRSDLVTWDSQGRIRVKDDLLGYAGLTDTVVLVGAFDSFELWNPQRLAEEGELGPGDLGEAAEYVGF